MVPGERVSVETGVAWWRRGLVVLAAAGLGIGTVPLVPGSRWGPLLLVHLALLVFALLQVAMRRKRAFTAACLLAVGLLAGPTALWLLDWDVGHGLVAVVVGCAGPAGTVKRPAAVPVAAVTGLVCGLTSITYWVTGYGPDSCTDVCYAQTLYGNALTGGWGADPRAYPGSERGVGFEDASASYQLTPPPCTTGGFRFDSQSSLHAHLDFSFRAPKSCVDAYLAGHGARPVPLARRQIPFSAFDAEAMARYHWVRDPAKSYDGFDHFTTPSGAVFTVVVEHGTETETAYFSGTGFPL